ncbi:LamG domain-containing protein [Candidatus Parabeggiatoa sp. HSG14]|uniref:LamG domain-containing protein n=1 Tax=Candidatus Parabeggiatoa sp. HSG14 TaxID=3055593 RepID=UPI0025A87422|nr:LamG domain-containing protein [Thiotrichales bacterium HSG14]
MKIPKTKVLLAFILWLYGFGLMPVFANAAKDERVADSASAIDTSEGTVAVHQSLNDENRFYIAPNFKFLAVNAKGDVARLGATFATKTDVIMKLQLVVPAVRSEVAKKLGVKQIWKVGNLPVNAIRVDLKTDSLVEKYGIETAYKIDSPAYAQKLDIVFSMSSDKAKEFIRDVNNGKVAFRLTYAFNQINIDSHYEELSASFIRDSSSLRRLDQQGKELMTAEQMAEVAKSIRKEITSRVITSLGGKIEPRSIPVTDMMEIFEVGDMVRKTEAELAEFDRRWAEQLNLRVNPKDFQPFRVQKHVIESLNSTKNVAKQRQNYARNYNRNKTKWEASASACAGWGWGSACASGSYASEAEKISDKTAMSNDKFRDFIAKSHGAEYDTEKRLFRGIKIYDTQNIKSSGGIKFVSVTIKPTLKSGIKNLDLVPKSQNSLYKGLVAYYPFDGNANDESGNGNHGENHGATLVKGKFGKAYSFNGKDSRIKLSASAIQGTELTINVWVNPRNIDGETLISGANRSESNEYLIYVMAGKLKLYNRHRNESVSFTINDNQWHNLTVVTKIDQTSFYIDGLLKETLKFSLEAPLKIEGLWLGGDQDVLNGGWQTGDQFDGVIDELRIYNRVLSDFEIRNLYRLSF